MMSLPLANPASSEAPSPSPVEELALLKPDPTIDENCESAGLPRAGGAKVTEKGRIPLSPLTVSLTASLADSTDAPALTAADEGCGGGGEGGSGEQRSGGGDDGGGGGM